MVGARGSRDLVANRIGAGAATIAACLVGSALLASCSGGTTSDAGTPSAIAPISATGLTLAGKPSKGADLLLNGDLTNTSNEPITVVGGSAYFATQLQVIKNEEDGGKKSVTAGVTMPIDANSKVTLSPSSYQIRVLTLTQSLEHGSTVPLNVTLANGKTMTVQAVVE